MSPSPVMYPLLESGSLPCISELLPAQHEGIDSSECAFSLPYEPIWCHRAKSNASELSFSMAFDACLGAETPASHESSLSQTPDRPVSLLRCELKGSQHFEGHRPNRDLPPCSSPIPHRQSSSSASHGSTRAIDIPSDESGDDLQVPLEEQLQKMIQMPSSEDLFQPLPKAHGW